MDRAAVLARFDAEIRADPAPEPGVERTWVDGVLRTTGGAYDFIGWWDFPATRLAEIVERETRFFRERTDPVEWKVFSHDGPPGLEAALAAAGWIGEEAETFVVLDTDEGVPPLDAAGLEIREVTSRAGFADFLAVNAVANDRPARQSVEELEQTVDDPGLAYFVAYDEGRPVASAGLQLPSGRAFAGLYSGGTVPNYRGRGAYRALVAARAQAARRRGYRYLWVDARETSRPILERLGFIPLATIRAWTLAAAGQPGG